MMMKKPDQVIDEITGAIYPPAEAVVNQLSTIRAIIPSTIKMYESTKDIHTIQPNLDMIQRAIDYLRGAPMRDELKPTPEDTLKPIFVPSAAGFNVTTTLNRDGEYDVSIVGIDVDPVIIHEDLFGDPGVHVSEVEIDIPIICGRMYLIAQENPMLEYYEDDPNVIFFEGKWVKEKEYVFEDDFLQYSFLLQEGRSKVKISICGTGDESVVFNITSHIHFKKEELPNEEDKDSSDNG